MENFKYQLLGSRGLGTSKKYIHEIKDKTDLLICSSALINKLIVEDLLKKFNEDFENKLDKIRFKTSLKFNSYTKDEGLSALIKTSLLIENYDK